MNAPLGPENNPIRHVKFPHNLMLLLFGRRLRRIGNQTYGYVLFTKPDLIYAKP